MKNIVVFDEYQEGDLKPSGLLHKYIELTGIDVEKYFLKAQKLEACSCPACFHSRSAAAFGKFGLGYQECGACHTLFVSPRPSDHALNEFYRSAPSRIFWREELSRATSQKRNEKIVQPRFQWILDSTREYHPRARHLADINTNQFAYIEEIARVEDFDQKTLVSPFLGPAELKTLRGVEIVPGPWWEAGLKNVVDVVTLFEVADHTADPEALFKKVREMLKPGGLVFMTAIVASGFDVQVLWEKAENLYPPDRLNVFTVDGLKILFERLGFECLELSTPGVLDVDIVLKALKENPGIPLPRFVRGLLEHKDPEIKRAFQEFLQTGLMSSYSRIILRKK